MVNCGWTRISYLLFALTILIALAQVSGPSDEPQTLATVSPGGTTVEENAPAADGGLGEPAQTARRGGAADRGSPVFYRPVPASPASGVEPVSGPACADLGAFPSDRRIAFPLPREYLGSYEDTWGAPRPQGGHEGTDLMAPTGTAAYAVTDGTIVAVAGANENGWNSLGGYTVMLKAAYSVGPVKQGDLFYYAHLNHESALEIGTTVSAGQSVGYVGNTGKGPELTRGVFPPHLHIGWYAAGSAVTSGSMNPYPLLAWIGANGGAVTGGSDARYCEVPRVGGPIPSAGESRWPASSLPGMRPDRATGASRPAPAQQGEHAQNERQPDAPGETTPGAELRTTGSSSSEPPSLPRAAPPPDSSPAG